MIVQTKESWSDVIAAMHSGNVFECDGDVFDYFLGVLPPQYMGRDVRVPDKNVGENEVGVVRAAFGFAEGPEKIVAFWVWNGRYFGCQTDEIGR